MKYWGMKKMITEDEIEDLYDSYDQYDICPICGGEKRIEGKLCKNCGGRGFVNKDN